MPRRRRRMSFLELFYLVVLTGILVGTSVWLDRKGIPVTARVQEKHERITVMHEPTGGWARRWEVGAAFALPNGSPMAAAVQVPGERWDALRVGDPIEIRYLPALPILARTTDRSTAGVAWNLLVGLLGIPILIWGLGGLAGLWIASRLGRPVVIAGGIGWVAAAFPLLFPAPPPSPPMSAEAVARVHHVALVTKSPARRTTGRRRYRTTSDFRRLAIPYQVVELAVPTAAGDTVLAVDAVDSGSVAGLEVGAMLPIRLDPAAPRHAQLRAGTRRFVERNRYHFLPSVLGAGVLGTVAALLFRRRRPGTTATRHESSERPTMPAAAAGR